MAKEAREFSVLGPLMGGFGSQAFLGCVHGRGPHGPTLKPAVFVFIPDEIVESKELFRKVWAETELAEQIDHVNVIGVMGVARLEEGYARVVEYADAESLRSVYRRAQTLKKPMPPAIAIALVADACMGVHYAHELGDSETGTPWVHGGVRPETLQVSFAGMAKVTGYGAQVLADSIRKKGGTGLITRDTYTAPEQAIGGRAAATVQSDVYALGCVLYEALTGKPPFSGDKDLAEAMIKDELMRATQGNGAGASESVSAAAAAIILKATQKKSVDRYQSALDMRMELFERCEPANEGDIKRYLDELFPPDAVPRATRIQMLRKAQREPPAPTGRLLVEMPAELQKEHKERAAIPDDADIESRIGQKVEDLPLLEDAALVEDVPAAAAAAALVQRTLEKPASPPAAVADVPPSWSAATTQPPQTAPPSPSPQHAAAPEAPLAPVPPAAAPVTVAPAGTARRVDELTDPTSRRPRQRLEPLPPPSPPPQVVYKVPAGLLVGIGLFGGVALALAAVLIVKTSTPPPAPVPPSTPVPTPAPVAAVPAPPSAPSTPPTPEPALQPLLPTKPEPGRPPEEPVPPKVGKPAAKGPGTLVITSSPSLTLTVDGEPAGEGSATVEVPAGKHTVVGKGDGATVKRVVTVKPGGTERVSLIVQKGSLEISAPDGCEVFVDGKRIGTTPLDPFDLNEGMHKVVVKKGGIPVTQNVPIIANMTRTFSVTFSN